jgi:DnaJ-class molecular chaperone
MADPYKLLGVQRGDTADTIRAAFRKLAKKHHPDVNPGRPEAGERFKEIGAAYDLLSDPDKRARYDRGEIDETGAERAPTPPPRDFYRAHAEAPGGGKYRAETAIDPEDLEALFGTFNFGGGGRPGRPARGADAQYALTVSFLDAARGTQRRITLPDGRTLDVTIPAGLADGSVLRLRGQGGPGRGEGAPAGDALVEISVAPHPLFRRQGNDILLRLPVTLREAVLGASIDVPTIEGRVRLAIPPGSGTGTKLRLRKRGILGGNQVVELDVVVPPGEEPALAAFLKSWTPRQEFDPRAGDAWSRAEDA